MLLLEGIELPLEPIVHMETLQFNDMMKLNNLTDRQQIICRQVRRRAKNKRCAQRSRVGKLTQIRNLQLADERVLKELEDLMEVNYDRYLEYVEKAKQINLLVDEGLRAKGYDPALYTLVREPVAGNVVPFKLIDGSVEPVHSLRVFSPSMI